MRYRAQLSAQTHQQRLPPPRQGPGWRDEDGPEVGSVDDQYQWGAAGQAVVWPAPGDGDTGIDAMRQLIEEQRQAYERSMRALASGDRQPRQSSAHQSSGVHGHGPLQPAAAAAVATCAATASMSGPPLACRPGSSVRWNSESR